MLGNLLQRYGESPNLATNWPASTPFRPRRHHHRASRAPGEEPQVLVPHLTCHQRNVAGMSPRHECVQDRDLPELPAAPPPR